MLSPAEPAYTPPFPSTSAPPWIAEVPDVSIMSGSLELSRFAFQITPQNSMLPPISTLPRLMIRRPGLVCVLQHLVAPGAAGALLLHAQSAPAFSITTILPFGFAGQPV